MEFYTDQNDLNKLDLSPRPSKSSNKKNPKLMDIFVTSIMRFKKLAELSIDGDNSFIKYVIFIAFLVGIISMGVPAASRIASFGGFNTLFNETMPQFSVNDGILESDQKFEMKLSSSYLVMDTSIKEFKEENLNDTGVYMTFGSSYVKMITYINNENASAYNEVYSVPIRMVFPDGFNNKVLSDMTPMFYITMIILVFLSAFVSAIKYLLLAFLYTVLMRSTTMLLKLPMTLKDTYHLCFYSQTIGILLVNANTAIGYIIPQLFASIAGVIITVVVINNAMKPYYPDLDDMIDKFKDK